MRVRSRCNWSRISSQWCRRRVSSSCFGSMDCSISARRSDAASVATSTRTGESGSENPCLARLQDSANAVGQDSSRFPRISAAKVPARRRGPVPADTSFLTAVRKASNAVETGGLSRVGLEGEGRRRMAGAESRIGVSVFRVFAVCAPRLKAPRIDFALQPAHYHVFDATTHDGGHLAGAGEAHWIKHLQQAGERACVAVVWGRSGARTSPRPLPATAGAATPG